MEITGNTIKKDLRLQGFNTKKISASVRHFGYGDSTITVEVKDFSIDIRALEKYLNKKYRDIRYDEHVQGEILQGCNTYVNVKYESDLYHDTIDSKLEEAEKLYKEMEAQDTYYGIPFFENDSFKAHAFIKDKIISVSSKDENDNNIYRRHVLYNAYNLAEALVQLEIYGNFGLA